ncbi:MAG: 30S ribosomal protein S4 [Thermoanaerobaculia bacterium]
MARYTDAKCRICRRLQAKLFLKGERCYKEKCGFERRNYAPGQHGQKGRKLQSYGLQLQEKQKMRYYYGLAEKQFKKTFEKAQRMKGVTGENLLSLLERRLDNVVYQLGFASSRAQARQLVRHGHILVNGRKTNIPSYTVKVGQEISLRQDLKENPQIQANMESARGRGIPSWLELDSLNLTGKVIALPSREDIKVPFQESLVVELYSK